MPPPNMTPRIDPVAYVTADNLGIEAYGPIEWDPATVVPEEIRALFTVVVSQVIQKPAASTSALPTYETVTAIGASSVVYAHGAVDWWATASIIQPAGAPARAFVVGQGATVAAWATIALDDGGGASYAWTLPVTVRPHAERPAAGTAPTMHRLTP
jgi:hypothetical protein